MYPILAPAAISIYYFRNVTTLHSVPTRMDEDPVRAILQPGILAHGRSI